MENTAPVPMHALRQILTEAIAGTVMRNRGTAESDGSDDGTLIRCAAYVLGGTYYAGYDTERASAWRDLCAIVREAITHAVATMPEANTDRWATEPAARVCAESLIARYALDGWE